MSTLIGTLIGTAAGALVVVVLRAYGPKSIRALMAKVCELKLHWRKCGGCGRRFIPKVSPQIRIHICDGRPSPPKSGRFCHPCYEHRDAAARDAWEKHERMWGDRGWTRLC